MIERILDILNQPIDTASLLAGTAFGIMFGIVIGMAIITFKDMDKK